jgi:hypothetical protein
MGRFAQLLETNDRLMTPLTRDLRLGHVLWGVGIGGLAFGGDPWLIVLLLVGGLAGMIHGYIKDRPVTDPTDGGGNG